MKMEHYYPKTAEDLVAREKERKARTTLLMALPEDHLAKFHKMADAKEMWEAIKSRFGGNDESKKMQKYLLKQQFEGFSVSALKGLHKMYDSFNDLYNNLRAFERDVKGITASSSSNTQNVAFISADNTSSTNDVNQSSAPQLDYDDLEQINDDDIAKGNQDRRRREDGYNGNKARDNSRRPVYHDDSKALVTIDEEDIDWSGHVEEDAQNYAMIAYSSSNSGSNNEVKSCSKTCEDSYARLKKLYDEQRDKLNDASIEITAYTLALKRLLNTQMTANDKFGLGYGDYRYGSILSYENEVLQSVFMNKKSDLENTSINDRYIEGMHAVPPPMTGNYMPFGPGVEIDYSKFTYGPKQTLVDESDTKTSEYAFYESDSVETTTSMPEPVENAPKDDPHGALKDKRIIDSGCSMHMTGNKAHLGDYQEFKGGSVAFGSSNGRITGKGKIKAGKLKGIKIEYSNARTLQQNGVAKRKNMTLIEAARTVVLVTKPQNKTPYELLNSKQPNISYLRPFGCHVTILNTINQLGKFDEKFDLGFLVGYSLNSKAFRVYNLETKRVEENLHVNFLKNKPNVAEKGHAWMFDLDYLTNSMNYKPVSVENQANKSAGLKEANNSAGYNWRNKRNPWNKVFNYNSRSKFRKNVKDPLGRLKSKMA
nr:hypothetical protein [Tanacetum cinerariifolium]